MELLLQFHVRSSVLLLDVVAQLPMDLPDSRLAFELLFLPHVFSFPLAFAFSGHLFFSVLILLGVLSCHLGGSHLLLIHCITVRVPGPLVVLSRLVLR